MSDKTANPNSRTIADSTLIESLVRTHLRSHVIEIDRDGVYPVDFLRRYGSDGGFVSPDALQSGLHAAIEATAQVARACGSTAFLTWCQNACLWYLLHTPNVALRNEHLPSLAHGLQLGATALSNPVKAFSSIEPFKLSGERVPGGFRVNGALPWVSNLGPNHVFASIFRVGESTAMALFNCDQPGLVRQPTARFAALEGTATFALRFGDVFVPDQAIITNSAKEFLPVIQPGFVLLQTGIGLGLLRGAIDDMISADRAHSRSNQYLPCRPSFFSSQLADFEVRITELASLPTESARSRLTDILRLRLDLAETVLSATQSAVLHAGAAGFLANATPQRRHREALFFAILTPATKHLRLLLSESPGQISDQPTGSRNNKQSSTTRSHRVSPTHSLT